MDTNKHNLLREYVLPNGSSRLAGYVKEASAMGEAVTISTYTRHAFNSLTLNLFILAPYHSLFHYAISSHSYSHSSALILISMLTVSLPRGSGPNAEAQQRTNQCA
jgi:hypothetical protein